MENNISNLIHEREMINSRMESMIYGSIEIREKSNNRYVYVHRRIDKIEPHTHLFVSKALFFLSIFEKKYRKINNYCAYVNEFSQLIYKVYKCIFLLCICH